MKRKVVALFGKTSSGKSTCASYVKRAFNYEVFEIGNYVRDLYQKDSNYDGTVVDYANWNYEQGTLTRFVASAIAHSKQLHGNILFCGVRIIEELECLKREFPDIIMVRIDCSTDKRSRRYSKGNGDKIDFFDRDEIENRWIKNEWDSLRFDYIIVNDDGLDEYYKRIDSVFSEIARSGSS